MASFPIRCASWPLYQSRISGPGARNWAYSSTSFTAVCPCHLAVPSYRSMKPASSMFFTFFFHSFPFSYDSIHVALFFLSHCPIPHCPNALLAVCWRSHAWYFSAPHLHLLRTSTSAQVFSLVWPFLTRLASLFSLYVGRKCRFFFPPNSPSHSVFFCVAFHEMPALFNDLSCLWLLSLTLFLYIHVQRR